MDLINENYLKQLSIMKLKMERSGSPSCHVKGVLCNNQNDVPYFINIMFILRVCFFLLVSHNPSPTLCTRGDWIRALNM